MSSLETPRVHALGDNSNSCQLGHGIGLRSTHFSHILNNGVQGVDWFEVISENFVEPGGRPLSVLEKVRCEVPVVMHGVSMGIGNVDPLNRDYLKRLRQVFNRFEPAWVSDHLCWGGYGGHYAHDLLPLPYTEECLNHVVERIGMVQELLGRQILLENVSSYVAYTASGMPEWTFLTEVVKRADCRVLLDINNVIVSSRNHNFDAHEYIDHIPVERVGQFHLAGHTDCGSYLFDSHIGPVPESVWDLYRYAVKRFGCVPTLIEWDEDIPDYDDVVAESHKARSIEAEALHAR